MAIIGRPRAIVALGGAVAVLAGGLPLAAWAARWDSPTITYRNSSTYKTAVRRAVYWWNRTPTRIHLISATSGRHPDITIRTVRVPAQWVGLAYFPPDGRVMLNAFGLGQPDGGLLESEVAAHEIGHALGLPHSRQGCSLEYPTAGLAGRCPTGRVGRVACGPQRTDVHAINRLYGYPGHRRKSYRSTCSTSLGDSRAPGAPTALSATPGSGSVELRWRNPRDGDFFAVRIVRKRDSGPSSRSDGTVVYEGDQQSAVDTEVGTGGTYHYAVYASDVSGNWSKPARASATVEATAAVPPGAPSTLSAYRSGYFGYLVYLSWTNPTDADVVSMRLVRKSGSAPTGPEDGVAVVDTQDSQYLDLVPDLGAYYYGVFAQDRDGNWSQPAVTLLPAATG